MPDDLYDRDFLEWAERQAGLLRRLAVGERVNAELDWPNLVEEVEDLGRAELHAVESLVEQALAHLLKLRAMPGSQASGHWRDEILAFVHDAGRRFTPSMRQRLDLDGLYGAAHDRARVAAEAMGTMPRPWPDACPFALDDLIAPGRSRPDVDALLAKLGPAQGCGP